MHFLRHAHGRKQTNIAPMHTKVVEKQLGRRNQKITYGVAVNVVSGGDFTTIVLSK